MKKCIILCIAFCVSGIQAQMTVKDGDDNTLMTVNDEGTTGSISLPAGSAPSATTNKLYNVSTHLYWNGSELNTGAASDIDGLSDGATPGTSVYLGGGAGANDDGTDNENVGLGNYVLNTNTSGDTNTAVGNLAMAKNTAGHNLTAFGYEALYNNTTGYNHTAIGYQALYSNTDRWNNTAVGYQSLRANSSGWRNTAVGHKTLLVTDDGIYNTAMGHEALVANTSGSDNTAIGGQAMDTNTTGSNNTAVGYAADVSTGDLVNATAIGYLAVVDASNKVRIGNASVTVIEGQVAFTYPSDVNKKENFLPVSGSTVLERIRDMDIQSWNYIGHDPSTSRHYGPVAQDFYAAFGQDAMGTVGSDTTLCGSDVDGINMIAIQALEKRTAEQFNEIGELRTMVSVLQKENAVLKTMIDDLYQKRMKAH
ncbi:tail fiber domain-containing protein [bacterium]|nr:tail fiber domain-containing protein [bacterium]